MFWAVFCLADGCLDFLFCGFSILDDNGGRSLTFRKASECGPVFSLRVAALARVPIHNVQAFLQPAATTAAFPLKTHVYINR